MYDYAPGKQDWLGMGLPTEGWRAERPRAGDVCRHDVPTCALSDLMGDVRAKVRAAGWDAVVVVNDERVVLGLLRSKELGGGADDAPASSVMRPGPSTYRAFVDIQEMSAVMIDHDMANCPITTSDGRLVGLLIKEDAAQAALELHEREHHAHEG